MLLDGVFFKQGTAAFGGLFIQGGEQGTGGILIEPVNEPDLARRTAKASAIEVVLSLKGGAIFGIEARGVRVREHTCGLVDHDDETIPVKDRTLGDQRRGFRHWNKS